MFWFVKLADFMAPKKGSMVSITWRSPSGVPDRYYLVEDVDSSGGQWSARLRGESGQTRLVHSPDVKNWQRYSGQPYEWHQSEIEMAERRRVEAEEKALVEAFRNEFRFKDGRPINAGMFLNVNEDAPGDLGMFAGRRLRVANVDYQSRTVKLKPFGWDEPEFEQFLEAVSATDVVAGTTPAVAPSVEGTSFRLQTGEVVSEADLADRAPNFGQALENGQVRATVRVYSTYESGGVGGEDRYLNDMAQRGYEPDREDYSMDVTPRLYNADGSPANIFGPYSAHITIAPPVSDELIEEVRTIAPKSQVKGNAERGLFIDSKPLFMLMIDSGHHDKIGRQPPNVATWMTGNLKVAMLTAGPTNPEWFD